uniref:Lectin, mannose binding 2 like n=1 Tax=Bos mutus grunniens TaxID=30521 RepID=A0A8B9YZY6_BOSMU
MWCVDYRACKLGSCGSWVEYKCPVLISGRRVRPRVSEGPFPTHPRWEEDSWRQVLRSVTSWPCPSSDPLSVGPRRLLVTRQSGRPVCREELSFVCRSPATVGTGVPAALPHHPLLCLPAFPAVFPHLCHGEQRLPQLRSRAGWAAYRAGGCTAIVRNLHYDTFLVIRYVKRHLTIMMDIDGKHEWRDCIEVPGVRLPRGYYFGTSSITGDLSDNHDVISLKLFELTVERTPEEEKLHRDVFLPSVDNMKLPEMTAPLPPLSGLALFLIVFFSLVFSVFAIVIGIILYNKWQDQSRKRFY